MPDPLNDSCLTSEQRRRWGSFVDLHDEGRRSEALAALDALIASLAQDHLRRDEFAEALAVAWIDALEPGEYLPTLLRYPLWRDVLLPHLQQHVGAPDGARRIGVALSTGSVGRGDDDLPGALTAVELLQRAAEHETAGTQARRWLLHRLLNGLQYAFHELPAGVLAEPEELDADADWLQRIASELQRDDELQAVVSYVRQQAAAMHEFRRRTDRSSSYEALLASLGISWRDRPARLR